MPHAPPCMSNVNCAWTRHRYECPAAADMQLLQTQPHVLTQAAEQLNVTNQQLYCCCAVAQPVNGGNVCMSDGECRATRHATTAGACPAYLLDTWFSLPGFPDGTNVAMGCRINGGWLAPGVERFRPMHYGPTRKAAFRVSPTYCSSQQWTYSHSFSEGAAMVGAEIDMMRVLYAHNMTSGKARARLNVTVLRMRSAHS